MTCFSASNLSGRFIGKLCIVLPVSAIVTSFSASDLSGRLIGKLYIVLPVSAIMTCFSASNLSGRFIGKLYIVLEHLFNPFKPNGISHLYQMEHSISVLKDIWWYFSSLFKFQ